MKIEIFSTPQCGYCNQAKEILARRGIAYTDLDISDAEQREELLRRLPRTKAIPQIFVDGEHIGGYEDLLQLAETGRLDEMMAKGAG
jgi:glutaredoxin 3